MDNRIFDNVVENYSLKIRQTQRLSIGEGRNHSLVDGAGNKYILKVYEIEQKERVSFITTILEFLQPNSQIQFPRPVKNTGGVDHTLLSDKILVLLHWIQGTTVEFTNPTMAQELGQAVCTLDDKLGEFYNTHQIDYDKYEDSIWNVTNIHRSAQRMPAIRHLLAEHYGLINCTIAHFDRVYPDIRNTFDKTLIHNDVNPGNVLYNRRLKLTGIIDLHEISHTYRICEVGITLAYLMQISGSDCMNVGSSFVRGYAKGYHFTVDEKRILLLLVKLRLSITIIYNTLHLHSGKTLTGTQAQFIWNAKALLKKLSDVTCDEFVAEMFPPG